MALDWWFPEKDASDAAIGVDVASLLFANGIEGFVRETLQNSNDQRLGDDAVEVVFRFELFDGESKAQYLAAMGWETLKGHIKTGSEARTSMEAPKLARALERINRRQPLLCVTVEDRNSRGLVGGDYEDGKNYKSLVKDIAFQGNASRTGGRGGSWGLGKAAALGASGIATVLFSSNVPDADGELALRLAGRTILPSHSIGAQLFTGVGWFGRPANHPVRGLPVAESAWGPDAEPVANQLFLSRSDLGQGTSLSVVDFHDPDDDRLDRPTITGVQEIADEVGLVAAKNFWPAIRSGRLGVTIQVRNNGKLLRSDPVSLDHIGSIRPYLVAFDASGPGTKADRDGAVGEASLAIELPAPTQGGEASSGQALLRVTRATPVDDKTLNNRIALVRGSGMVVRYYSAGKPSEELPYFGFCAVGLAADGGEVASEEFFTAAEPPSHADWTPSGNPKLGIFFRLSEAKASLNGFFGNLDKKVRELCGVQVDPSRTGPADLSKRFPLGNGVTDKGVHREITVEFPEPYPQPDWEDGTLTVAGITIRLSNAEVTPPDSWGFRAIARAESYGKAEPLSLQVGCSIGVRAGDSEWKEIESGATAAVDVTVALGDVPSRVPISLIFEPAHMVSS